MRLRATLTPLAGLAALLLVAAPAAWAGPAAEDDAAAAADPLEPINRQVHAFNTDMRALFIGPTVVVYRGVVPGYARNRVSDFLANLRAPVVFANDLLQGEFGRAAETFARFGINTTVGLFGSHDAAAEMGIPAHDEDFGQTLAVWGVGSGPYLVLPILGPSNLRDASGFVADAAADVPNRWAANTGRDGALYARAGGVVVDEYDRVLDTLTDIEESSLDPYAALRSLYRQSRRAAIANDTGFEALETLEAPDFDMDMNMDMDMPPPASGQR